MKTAGLTRCWWPLLIAFLVSLPSARAAAPAPATTNSLAGLRAQLSDYLAQPRLAAAALGIKVVSLATGKTVFEQNAGKLLKPASNNKLYTGALALDRLGPEFRIKTSFYAAAKPEANGALNGDLIVYGRGDFSQAARFNNGDYKKGLATLVDAIAAAGVKTISGDLVGDESYFQGPGAGSGWTWDDLQYYYGAEASALTLEDNVVDLSIKPGPNAGEPCQIVASPANQYLKFVNRTTTTEKESPRAVEIYRPIGENTVYITGAMKLGGPAHSDAVAVHDPALWYVTLLKDALADRGITIGGRLRTVNWLNRDSGYRLENLSEIAAVESRPLAELLSKMLKPSQNLYAQLLLLQVGAKHSSDAKPGRTTEDLGVAEMQKFLAETGIKKGQVLLEEGSGLSRSTLLTPAASVTLLQFMNQHRHASVFRDGLPIAGVDGTLRNRFANTAAANNVRAKTGTLRYVNSISGYLTTSAGEPLVFSIMLNNYSPSDSKYSGRAEVDALVVLLTSLGQLTAQAE